MIEDKGQSTSMPDEETAGSPRSGLAQAQQGCSFFARFIMEMWRRIRLEFVVELPLLKQRWKVLLFGIAMQYVHGIFTQLAHRMHQPQDQPLHDVGFDLTLELGPDKHWVSETLFGLAFASFVLWTFSPFVSQHKRIYTVVIWTRLLMVLVVCQVLRIITFSVTQLPGPSFHCRANEPTAQRPWPAHWTGHLVVDVGRQVSKSCGDLIFSSHTTFMLTGVLAYNEYGSLVVMKAISWLLAVVLSVLIVASRKHYTVDVVIAWYTVPLVFYAMYRRWTTRRPMNDFIGGPASTTSDDVDSCQMKLDEVLVDHGTGYIEPLFGCVDVSGLSGKLFPRPSTLMIDVRAPADGRHKMGTGHQDLKGDGGAYGLMNQEVDATGNKMPDISTRNGAHGVSTVPLAAMRGAMRTAADSADSWSSQQHLQRQQQVGQQLEDSGGTAVVFALRS
ncbi:hypothetical protein PLESTB_000949300 [Pleodorina starrii]|uniref:Sphingomyelin synthase-like domain-containing protein n=1 Tax=Pleodorina starrii TaxID=330485 RepID=A0A9W6BNQ1_9CHLO|nr:hypothetical protein PLESTM_001149500 [Pleodorina starrii]GLC55150.1 hypothetical protein PLESTB_000949300 [Pleodorina starrii]GLC71095.1 hypothetical protein PLESTF_001074000 [Pleodorina starrii]